MVGTKTMRLRLVVRRYNLPETRVLFNVPLDDDPTISQLLEQINAVIPLESDHWGLDDYALELRTGPDGGAFEALHYQHVAAILQHDEEVYIRPLLTPDLKKRRLSGRHQISTDGRHLVDGVPYGRPLLRHLVHRPSINIPPRKRRKLLADGQDDGEPLVDDEDSLIKEQQPPLQITQYGESQWQEEDDDSDFSEHDNTDEDLDEPLSEIDEDELTALHQDNVETGIQTGPPPSSLMSDENLWSEQENSSTTGSDVEDYQQRADELKRQLLGTLFPAFIPSDPEPPSWVHNYPKNLYSDDMDENLAILDLLACLGTAFPGRPMRDLMKVAVRCEYKARRIYKRLKRDDIPQMSYNRVKRLYKAIHQAASAEAYKFLDSQMNERSQRGEEHPVKSVDSDKDVDEAMDEDHMDYDYRSESEESVCSLVKYYDQNGFPPGSIMAGTVLSHMAAAVQGANPRKLNLEDNQQEAGVQNLSISGQDYESDSEDEGSEAESDSDSESSDDGTQDDQDKALATASKTALPVSDSSSDDTSDDSSDSYADSSNESSDDDVRASTPVATHSKVSAAEPDTSSSESSSEEEGDDEEDISSSDTDDDSESSSGSESDGPEEISSKLSTSEVALHHSEEPTPENEPKTSKFDESEQPVQSGANPHVDNDSGILSQPGKSKTRSRNARRRALKQVLKAKASAAERQSQTTVDVMNSLEARKNALLAALDTSASPKEPSLPAPTSEPRKTAMEIDVDSDTGTGDLDAWRAKINYSAVECVEEGVKLSEPPFPFVQRWDPQQRGYGHGGKRKRRGAADYYQAGDVGHSATKKLKFAGISEQEDEVTFLNYDDEDNDNPGRSGTDGRGNRGKDPEASAADSQFTDLDDLPSLPSDLSTLPLLKLGDAKPGMVITWKQWVLSEATSWQPQFSDVSAIVASVSNDGLQLRVVLALRDRDFDGKEKIYDEETGERIYGRFEMPDADDDDDNEHCGEEDGWRTLELSELIEARIQQFPISSDRDDSEAALTNIQVDVPETRVSGSDAEVLSPGHINFTIVGGEGEEAGQVSVEDANRARTEKTNDNPAEIQEPSTASGGQQQNKSNSLETIEGSITGVQAAQDARSQIATNTSVDNGQAKPQDIEISSSQAVSEQHDKPLNIEQQAQQQDLDSPSRQLEIHESNTLPKGRKVKSSRHDFSWQALGSSAAWAMPSSHGSSHKEVSYPSLDDSTSSAACSLRSGRQPDLEIPLIESEDDIAMDELDDVDESQMPNPQAPQRPIGKKIDSIVSSPSSSLLSISTLWQTCPSTRATGSPSSARLAAASVSKIKAERMACDKMYEEEMLQLDDESEPAEDAAECKMMSTEIKESHSQQQQQVGSLIALHKCKKDDDIPEAQTFDTLVSRPAPKSLRGSRRQCLRSKTLPTEKDHVINISSDSSNSELIFEENYADDGVDGDYESSQPRNLSSRKTCDPRGVSVPAIKTRRSGRVTACTAKSYVGRAGSAMPASQSISGGNRPSFRA